jgi:hypothetical protein
MIDDLNMHFNNSCTLCALAIMFHLKGLQTSDTLLAIKSDLPYIFLKKKKMFACGTQIIEVLGINNFVNSFNYHFQEKKYSKEKIIRILKQNPHKSFMLGINILNHKHALVFQAYHDDTLTYSFYYPEHAINGATIIKNYSESELRGVLDKKQKIGYLQEEKQTKIKQSLLNKKVSINNLNSFKKEILHWSRSTKALNEQKLKKLFFGFLVSLPSMLDLINNKEASDLSQKIKSTQKKLFSLNNEPNLKNKGSYALQIILPKSHL